MIYANDPPKLVKALMGIAAVMITLLSGVVLGVLSNSYMTPPIPANEASASHAPQEHEDGLSRPVMRMDSANQRGTNHDELAPCSQRMQQDAENSQATCSSQPLPIDKQKPLVLIALWRYIS